MAEILAFLMTAAALTAIGAALNAAWISGYWWLTPLLTAAAFAAAWVYSEPHEKQQFIDDVRRLWRPRR